MSRHMFEPSDLANELERPQRPTAASKRRRERKPVTDYIARSSLKPVPRFCSAVKCPQYGRAPALPGRHVCEPCAAKLEALSARIVADHSGHRGPPRP